MRLTTTQLAIMRGVQQGQTTFSLPDFETPAQGADFERLSVELLELQEFDLLTFPRPVPSELTSYSRFRNFGGVRLTAAGEHVLAKLAA